MNYWKLCVDRIVRYATIIIGIPDDRLKINSTKGETRLVASKRTTYTRNHNGNLGFQLRLNLKQMHLLE